MTHTIHTIHTQYHAHGDRAEARAQADRFDRLLADRVPAILGETLDRVFGGRPTVYVIREVKAHLRLSSPSALDDAALAGRWGEHLASAVAHTLAHGEGVVTFADQAEYVASFVKALFAGRAWDHWVFAAFAPLESLPLPAALERTLTDHLEQLPSVLVRLDEAGVLERVISELSVPTLFRLWTEGLGAPVPADPAVHRPTFEAALALVDDLGLWRSRPSRPCLLERYLATAPPTPDWRDARALSAAVLDVIRFLEDRTDLLQRPAVAPAVSAAKWDWLDHQWLAKRLDRLFSDDALTVVRPARRARRLTPRQAELCRDLAAAFAARPFALDRDRLDDPRNALRVFTALVSHAPKWAHDPLAPALIQQWLRALAEMTGGGHVSDLLDGVRRLGLEATLAAHPSVTEASLEFLVAVSAVAPELAIPVTGPIETATIAEPRTATRAAGVFLLARAVLDARLPAWAPAIAYPRKDGVGPLLAALAHRWAGIDVGENLDPGIVLFAGREAPSTGPALTAVWAETTPETHARFQSKLFALLVAHRLVAKERVHLCVVEPEDAPASLVLGDGSGRLWTHARRTEEDIEEDIGGTVRGWIEEWRDRAGCGEVEVLADASLAEAWPEDLAIRVHWINPDDDPTGDPTDALAAAHRNSREALLDAWNHLSAGRLGVPDADLTLFLAANALIRLWARWLRQFSASSTGYLLRSAIRRPGEVAHDREAVTVWLAPRALDVLLEMSGYLEDLEDATFLDPPHLRIRT